MDDAATTELFLKELQGKRGDSLALNDKILATMALEASRPGAKAGDNWPGDVTRAFRATENSDSPDSYMRWSYALADLLTSRQVAPEVVMALRKEGFDRVLKAKAEDNGRTTEGIRTASFLVETALAQGDPAAATAAVTSIVPVIKESSGKLSEESLRVLLKAVNLLAAANDTEQVASLVNAAEPDIRKSPKMTEAWSAYLKPGA